MEPSKSDQQKAMLRQAIIEALADKATQKTIERCVRRGTSSGTLLALFAFGALTFLLFLFLVIPPIKY